MMICSKSELANLSGTSKVTHSFSSDELLIGLLTSLLNQRFNKLIYYCHVFVHYLASLDCFSNFSTGEYWVHIHFWGGGASTCFSV